MSRALPAQGVRIVAGSHAARVNEPSTPCAGCANEPGTLPTSGVRMNRGFSRWARNRDALSQCCPERGTAKAGGRARASRCARPATQALACGQRGAPTTGHALVDAELLHGRLSTLGVTVSKESRECPHDGDGDGDSRREAWSPARRRRPAHGLNVTGSYRSLAVPRSEHHRLGIIGSASSVRHHLPRAPSAWGITRSEHPVTP